MKYVVARMKGRRDRSLIVNVARKEENILAKGVTNSLVHAMMESVYLEIKDSKRFKFAVRQAW
jgi:hypothetical protein